MKLDVHLSFSSERTFHVGTLQEIGRDTAFSYNPAFIGIGLDLAPIRLPQKGGLQVYDRSGNMETFGLFEDSLPDGWGRRLVDVSWRTAHGRLPSVLERLACVGAGGMGALTYEPAESLDGTSDFDLASLATSAMDFDAGDAEDVLPVVRKAGGSSGGARPKAFIGYNPTTGAVCAESATLPPGFEHWIVKFNTRRDGPRAGEEEYRHYQLAVRAGATMMPSRLIETKAGAFFATQRFDRTAQGGRLHFASAAGLLHADFRVPGEDYELLFRLTDILTRDYSAKTELFRRAALNVLAHNRDDHLKNFGYLMDEHGHWRLAPFYDFTRSEGPNGWQTLSVAGEGRDPGIADLRRLAERVGVKRGDAEAILDAVGEFSV